MLDERKNFKVRIRSSRMKIKWILAITLLSFFLSVAVNYIASNLIKNVSDIIAIIIVILIIMINVFFDIIGTASAAADEAPFHAMSSRKVYGASVAIKLIKNADKVSTLCNDVIGDISGVLTGAASFYIILKIVGNGVNVQTSILSLSIGGLVACLTVGGKAFGKIIAINNSNYFINMIAVILTFLRVDGLLFRKKRTYIRKRRID
jgi:Mg2+/Co2+ transporter CorB